MMITSKPQALDALSSTALETGVMCDFERLSSKGE